MKLNKKGFTLIELLAVIVIIAIIALIGIPSVTKIMDNSRKDAVKSTALSMVSAAKNLIAAENYTVPEDTNADSDPTTFEGCFIMYDDLRMESTKLPAGGNVYLAGSFVKVINVADTYTYRVTVVSAATSANGIVDKVSSDLVRGDVFLDSSLTAPTTGADDTAVLPTDDCTD